MIYNVPKKLKNNCNHRERDIITATYRPDVLRIFCKSALDKPEVDVKDVILIVSAVINSKNLTAEEKELYDWNSDGRVNILDIFSYVKWIVSNNYSSVEYYDMNKNNKVDYFDICRIVNNFSSWKTSIQKNALN